MVATEPRNAAESAPATASAVVSLPDQGGQVRRFELTAPGPGQGWLRVSASGVCGTDVALFGRGLSVPTVLGHHVVARVAALGEGTGRRRGLELGDRLVLEEYLPCGRCATCLRGPYRLCPHTDVWRGGRRVGTVPADEPPGLHGGNAEFVFLPENAVVHRLPDDLGDALAAWVLPYANAIDWLRVGGALSAGERVAVLGPGYHGLAVAAAARWAGADEVIVTGLARDAQRLEIAEALGARPAVTDSAAALTSTITTLAGGAIDVVVDTVGTDPAVLAPSLDALGHGGRLVLTSPKNPGVASLDTVAMIRRGLRVAGVRGRSPQAIATSISSLARGTSGLEVVPSVEVGLEETTAMLRRLAAGTGPESPHLVVRPDRA